jgi:CheY-like chemotaxis protein
VGRAEPKRILVVDDNLPLRLLAAQALESAGYVAFPADSAEAALEVARFVPPDLCLVDQDLPGMNGAELIRTLRASSDERLRAIPAIGLAGLERAAADLVAAGALFALPKPLDEGPWLERVEQALRDPTESNEGPDRE